MHGAEDEHSAGAGVDDQSSHQIRHGLNDGVDRGNR